MNNERDCDENKHKNLIHMYSKHHKKIWTSRNKTLLEYTYSYIPSVPSDVTQGLQCSHQVSEANFSISLSVKMSIVLTSLVNVLFDVSSDQPLFLKPVRLPSLFVPKADATTSDLPPPLFAPPPPKAYYCQRHSIHCAAF